MSLRQFPVNPCLMRCPSFRAPSGSQSYIPALHVGLAADCLVQEFVSGTCYGGDMRVSRNKPRSFRPIDRPLTTVPCFIAWSCSSLHTNVGVATSPCLPACMICGNKGYRTDSTQKLIYHLARCPRNSDLEQQQTTPILDRFRV